MFHAQQKQLPTRSPQGVGTKIAEVRGNYRSGLAALEVVLTIGLMIPPLGFLLYLGFQTCRNYYSVVGSMIGSPF